MTTPHRIFVFLILLLTCTSHAHAAVEGDKTLFLGILIKNNDQLIPAFLKSIDRLDYDKKQMHVQLNIYNDTPAVRTQLQEWIEKNKGNYAQIICVEGRNPSSSMRYDKKRIELFSRIKDDYLSKTKQLECEYCLIIESDMFLAPFTLRHLMKKNKPIIAPLLRPTPEPNDPFRNFFCAATENGYYRDHPNYTPISERKKLGTFQVACVSGVYLIDADYVDELSFADEGDDWELINFARTARENGVDQYICNEKEFGSFLHFKNDLTLAEEKAVTLVGMDVEVTPTLVHTLLKGYCAEDPMLKSHLEQFRFDNYALYRIENRDIFYVDDIYDHIKTFYIRKGIAWEDDLCQQIKQYAKPGSVAVDIGGHMGTHTLNFSRAVGDSGTVHVFEPQAKMFCELVVNMHLNNCKNVVFHRCALGNAYQWVEMVLPRPDNEGMAYVKPSTDGKTQDKVKMEKLDDLRLNNVSMIKIDVEGFEMEVIEGARDTIVRNRPVMLVEIFNNAAKGEKIATLEGLGYRCVPLKDDDYLFLPN